MNQVIADKLKIPVDSSSLLLLLPFIFLLGMWKVSSVVILLIFFFMVKDIILLNDFNLKLPLFLRWLMLILWGLYITLKSPLVSAGYYYYVGTVIIPFIIFILIYNLDFNEKFLFVFFNLLLLTGIVLGIYSAIFLASYNFDVTKRIGSLWPEINILSGYMMILFLFNLSFIINIKKNKFLIFHLISLSIITFSIFLTQTRSVWLAIVISTLVFIIKRPKVILPVLITMGIIAYLFADVLIARFLTVKNFSTDLSSLGRLQAWLATIALLKENYLTGYGFESFLALRDQVYSLYLVPVPHSHNTYLNAMLEMGLIGAILYFSFFFQAFYYSYKMLKFEFIGPYKKYADGLQMSFLALLVVFIFEPFFSLYGNSTIFIWILITLSYKIFDYLLSKSVYHSQVS